MLEICIETEIQNNYEDENVKKLFNFKRVEFHDAFYDLVHADYPYNDGFMVNDFEDFQNTIGQYPSGICETFEELQDASSFEDLFEMLTNRDSTELYKDNKKKDVPNKTFADFASKSFLTSFERDDLYENDTSYIGTTSLTNFDRLVARGGQYDGSAILTITKVNTIDFPFFCHYLYLGWEPDHTGPIYFIYKNELWILACSWC